MAKVKEDEFVVENVDVDALTLDPKNARAHDRKSIDALKKSLRSFRTTKNIVIDKNNVVLAGNGLVMAAKELGIKQLPAKRVNFSGKKARAFAIADNKTAEMSAWNGPVLVTELAALPMDLQEVTGFSQREILGLTEKSTRLNQDLSKLPAAIQLAPQKEYVLIMADDAMEFEKLKAFFKLGEVRRGGYDPGSPFEHSGTERVVKARRFLEMVGAIEGATEESAATNQDQGKGGDDADGNSE